ncbi:hypothetical protein GCM10010172_55600 [Paractinoplanes ferrugineus]|uniref:Uncharacterized protein n=1 Tax=Paractinoplanes ferrugineus TaxID=113564 RepID=A0A919MDU9_9ACTN|nr:hypothetical protein [Actinoplanes ferrugineus]GIE10969.1 hypothetical protein Afe05nite_28090 [Actinoplanes ferrugineus]
MNHVRVINVYSLPWQYDGISSRNPTEELELGNLRDHYELYRDQLPRLLPDDFFGGRRCVENLGIDSPIRFDKCEAVLFALPSDQVVLAVVLEFDTSSLDETAAVLDLGIEGKFQVDGKDLATHLEDFPYHRGDVKRWRESGKGGLLPERHQLIFVRPDDDGPDDDTVERLVYRRSRPYSKEFARRQEPEQLNETIDGRVTRGVVTTYVSLLYGHQYEVEDSIYLSTVHAVGTASIFRQIWHDSYRQVREFRLKGQAQVVGQQTRDALEELADNLGNLEFDLTFSVEFPLMRIETFHTALYETMDLSGQARALSQMFSQLGGSLKSEITAIDVRERRRDEGRQKWNAFAAGVLSLVGVSVGFVIAFLGINAKEVPNAPAVSMWDSRFATVYLVAGLIALVPVFFILFPYLREWGRPRVKVARWTGVGALAAGAVIIGVAKLVDARSGHTLVLDAVLTSIGVLGLLIGLSLAWSSLRPRRRPA